jgi:hypothetical protein
MVLFYTFRNSATHGYGIYLTLDGRLVLYGAECECIAEYLFFFFPSHLIFLYKSQLESLCGLRFESPWG